MAGINLLFRKSKSSKNLNTFSDFMSDILYYQNIWSQNSFDLSIHKHDGYPYSTFSNLEYDVFVEGKIYNLTNEELDKQLNNLYSELKKNSISQTNISDILFKLDGDYIIVFHDKINNRIYLLNDLYGRLPLYYAENEEGFMLSRNMDVIINTLNKKEIDKYGVTEFLVFGYTVTERTLIEGISYFLPGHLLCYDLNQQKFTIQKIFTYNFESLVTVTKKSYNEKLKENVFLFKQSNLQRAGKSSIVGLSGGLDSRILAAGLKEVCPEVEAVSRLSFNNREKKDVFLADQVSKILNIPFKVITSPKPEDSYIESIIKLKGGLNSVENDYNLIYEKRLQSIYGNDFTYFTGDAGDRIKPHIRIHKAKNLNDFVEKLISMNSRLSLQLASEMLGVDSNRLKNDIYNYINSFPEKSYAYKDLHFRIYSRGFKYVLEGEDRKRNFFWTVMPFYGHQFFLSAMSFPDSFKKDYKMFFDFMNLLEPQLAQIVNKNWGLKPNDWRLPIYLLKSRMSKGLKTNLKALSNSLNNKSLVLEKDVKFYLKENNIYDESVYQKILQQSNMSRSKYLFLRTPILLKKYLDKNA